jgi:hypothetical protein
LRGFGVLAWLPLMAACSSTNGDIESAKFQLDHAQYDEAIATLEDVLSKDPGNVEATALLASAKFGAGYLGDTGSFLGLFKNFLQGQQEGLSDLESLREATPATAKTGKTQVLEAEDLLQSIDPASRTQEHYLQLAMSQLAIVTIFGVAEIGGLDSGDPCTYTASEVDSAEEARFASALNEVDDSFVASGIDDFNSTDLGSEIADLQTAYNTANDFAEFVNNEFGNPSCP